MRKIHSILLLAVLAAVAVRGPEGFASEADLPFYPGEKLTFKLSWGIFSAGTAELEVHPMAEIDGEEAYHFSLVVRTNSFVDRIYKVRDRIDAYASSDMGGSTHFTKKQKEGSHERDIVVTFDREAGTARYSNYGKEREPIEIEPNTFDPLSVFYAFRMIPIREKSTVELNVTDGKEMQVGQGRIGGRKTISVPAGEFETILVEPDMKDVGGVFEESDDATFRIWVTNDSRRIPVRLSSKVIVGSFKAELIEIAGEEPPEPPEPPAQPRQRR